MPFGGVEFLDGEIESPWSDAALGTWHSSGDLGTRSTALKVTVRTVRPEAGVRSDSRFIFDNPAKSSGFGMDLGCVTLARHKGRRRTHYVMLVIPASAVSDQRREPRWERVGVGYLPDDLIESEGVHALLY